MSRANSVEAMDIKTNEKSFAMEIKIIVIYPFEKDEDQREKQRLISMEVYNSRKIEIPLVLLTVFPNKDVLKDHLGYKLVNDHAEQRLEVTRMNDPEWHIAYVIEVMCPTIRVQELNNFSKLFDSKKFSDVTLYVRGRVIRAHKNIIANKSPVFEAMFTHKMFESQLNKVEIEDLDYDTVYDFLYYIYAGKLREDCTNDEFARYSNLFIAADKYDVNSLKERCEQQLPLFLSIENVLRCLVLADLHSSVDLKKEAMNFIVSNADEIIELPSYKSFLELYPDLSIEITRALVVEKKNAESAVKKDKFGALEFS